MSTNQLRDQKMGYYFQDTEEIVQSLPPVRGRISLEVNLDKVTWFRVGGPAQILFKPADLEDLQFFLKNKPANLPVTPLGVGSNIIVRDGGVPGIVIRLGRSFNYIDAVPDEDHMIEVGASTLDRNVAFQSAEMQLGGLSFLSGIPGTIGGALKMNAGAYGTEIKDVLISVQVIDMQGNLHDISRDEIEFNYRKLRIPKLPEGYIFISAKLKGFAEKSEIIVKEIEEIEKARSSTQPITMRTGGSTFKNPNGLNPDEAKAWQLIDQSGCRGLIVGDAQVSELHCNFLINRGNATAQDIEKLGETVRQKVKENTGVDLEWEILRLGNII